MSKAHAIHSPTLIIILMMLVISISPVKAQDVIWKLHVIDNSFSGADGVRLADVNGDSLMDITTGFEEGDFTKVYIHPGHDKVNTPWPSVIVGKTPNVEDAVFADLDGDGA